MAPSNSISTQGNDDLEKLILGTIIADRSAYIDVADLLCSELFLTPINALIYSVFDEMARNSEATSLPTIAQKLMAHDEFKRQGGLGYLASICNGAVVGFGIRNQALVLRELWMKRAALQLCYEIIRMINDDEDSGEILEKINAGADRVNGIIFDAVGQKSTISDLARQSIAEAVERQKRANSGQIGGISTGVAQLDKKCYGFKGGELIVLAGRPAMGKTAVALHFMKAAAKSGTPVCFYSLEMSGVKLSDRLLLSECSVTPDSYRSGRISDFDIEALKVAEPKIASLPLVIDDNASATIRQIDINATVMHHKGQCGMVVIDYLQLVESTAERGMIREQQIAAISRGAKKLAKKLDIPVILLSQLNRAVEERTDKVPMMRDLRESGAIEQDADMVVLLYRPEYYGIKEVDCGGDYGMLSSNGLGIFIVAKQREGATGMVPFSYNNSLTKIFDYGVSTPPNNLPF